MTDEEISKAMRENLNLEMPPRRRKARMDFMKDEEMPKVGFEPKGNQFGLREIPMGSQIQTAIELRDRATQIALNFAGQRISSSDGSYELLIELIHVELVEAAKLDLSEHSDEPKQ